MNSTGPNLTRRPLKSRDTPWAAATTRLLIRIGLRPNSISILSVVCGGIAGAFFWLSGREAGGWQCSIFLVAAAVAMQLRLLCNLFDGMVAVEGGFKSKSGEIYNELPDRFSDAFIFIGAAYSSPAIPWMEPLGWSAAVLAVITAYVRALGASAGTSQQFIGPMAKQQRMATMTVACLVGALVPFWPPLRLVLPMAVGVVVGGSLITIVRRVGRIVRELESK